MGSATDFDFAAAEKLPRNILFGTSSWTYPGWQGSVYQNSYSSEKAFKQECLQEYANFPWFRTLGIDSSFYGPPAAETLQRYSEQLPEDFRWISKVWEEITIPHYARHPRYGEKAGKANPNFLNAELFTEQFLSPYESVREHTGPFVFQFQAINTKQLPVNEFLDRLDAFLGQLPSTSFYAIEVRNPEILCQEYFRVLNKHGATHCFNHWTGMPRLYEQMKAAAQAGGIEAQFFVARLLTPLGLSYQKAVERFQPYNKLQLVNQEMREDVVRLARRTIDRQAVAFILVNNRSEGYAPKTINDTGLMIIQALAARDEEQGATLEKPKP